MNARLKKGIKRFLFVLFTIYWSGGMVLYLAQDKILFHPESLPPDHKFLFDQPFKEINIPAGPDNLSIVKFKPTAVRKGIVLFYHGNMGNVEHYKKYPALFLRNGYEIWMVDYPGFGKTTGKRSEKNLDEAALRMYELASKEINPDSIVIYGKSIGTGVACYVASLKNCRQLFLETPYYSIASLAKHYFPVYPVSWMLRYTFPIHDYLKKVNAPIAILHGTNDEVVPYCHSRLLKEENKNIELITIPGGTHNNLSSFPSFQKAIDSLLSP